MTATLTQPTIEVPRLKLSEIRLHPSNPRRNAAADEGMVESIRHQGVLEPLMVAPAEDGDGWILIDGHRRYDGAEKAAVSDVPVNPRYDLVTEAQQIEVMVVTGLQKQLLTPVEEAAGYEQLTLLGMDAAAIAASTGFSQARVKARLRLNGLTEGVRGKIHDGQLTLGDAESLLEFADDPELAGQLEEAAGTNNFRWKVEDARGQRKRAAAQRDLIEEFEAAGALEVDGEGEYRRLTSFQEELTDPDAHDGGDDGCLRWIFRNTFGSWGDPFLVCVDVVRHGITPTAPADQQARESEWEKQRAAREAARARAVAAAAVRTAWLVEHLTGLLPLKGHAGLAKIAGPLVPMLVGSGEVLPIEDVARAFGREIEAVSYPERTEAERSFVATLRDPKPAQAIDGLVRILAALTATHLDFDCQYEDDRARVADALALWDWLAAAGYPMSDVDTEQRAQIVARLTDLDASEAGGDDT